MARQRDAKGRFVADPNKQQKATFDAHQRRAGRAGTRQQEIDWYIDDVLAKISMTLRQRVMIATELVASETVRNISIPVVYSGSTEIRSKPGEYPRADTTLLRKTIFTTIKTDRFGTSGYVGTPQDYGVILELKMNRSFLRRTLNEQRKRIYRILTGPIRR